MKTQTYLFCGGGSGGHVLPAITLIKAIREQESDAQIHYIGSYHGIESELIPALNIPYHGISTGKLRRYFSWENFTDLFRLKWGLIQSYLILLRYSSKHTVVISTGGFVTVPVVVAAWLQRKKIVLHEQTSRVGLANKLGSYFAHKIMITYEASKAYFPAHKTELTGYPLRREIFQSNTEVTIKGQRLSELDRPILFLTGGGNGSKLLNEHLYDLLPDIQDQFFIIHQVGKSFYEMYLQYETEYYKVFDFVGEDMIPLLQQASVIISRAGAGTVIELISLGKPSIFIPLKMAQKNEQFHNAMEANKKLGSLVIAENELSKDRLLEAIHNVKSLPLKDPVNENPTETILNLIKTI